MFNLLAGEDADLRTVVRTHLDRSSAGEMFSQVPGQRHQGCDVGAAQLHLGDRAELLHELRRMIDQLDDLVVPSAPLVGAATARVVERRCHPVLATAR
ncbi:MAG: hypothetical protein ACRDS0_05600 [Pseudonocardiaceae bacterium]